MFHCNGRGPLTHSIRYAFLCSFIGVLSSTSRLWQQKSAIRVDACLSLQRRFDLWHSKVSMTVFDMQCTAPLTHDLVSGVACMSSVFLAEPGCTADLGGQQHSVQLQLPAEHDQQCSCCQLCPLLWPVCNILQQLEGTTEPLSAIPAVAPRVSSFCSSAVYCSMAVFTSISKTSFGSNLVYCDMSCSDLLLRPSPSSRNYD